MDSVIFQAMAVDLNRRLAGSRLDRVVQIAAGTMVMKFWTGSEKAQLLLKADGRGSFHLTRQSHAAPAAPPRFCQLLRARLHRLITVRAEPLDRIVHFIFAGEQGHQYDLILEAVGAQGNLILTDASTRIVDLLRRQDGARRLLPGEVYSLPVQPLRRSLLDRRCELAELMAPALDTREMTRLAIAPMSPALAQAICIEREAGHSLDSILDRIQTAFLSGNFEAVRVTWDGKTGLLPLALGVKGFTGCARFDDLSAMMEADRSMADLVPTMTLSARLAKVIARQRKKYDKRLTNITAEAMRQSEPELLRVQGDLLLANLQQIPRGMENVEVDNYYQSPVTKLSIPLDVKLNPQENAERYFKLYRKAKRAGEHIKRRRLETEQEIAWLDQVELALNEADNADDLYQVQLELEAAGLLGKTRGQLGRRPLQPPEKQLYQAVSPSGLKLFWGKNSRTNDYVSRRLTGNEDFWFHAHRMPGCHLVMKCEGRREQVPEQDILYAASFAAGYAKGKDAGKVEVMVARGKDVRKPKGARPGLVTVDAYRTVLVVPRRLDNG
ncbi:MAG: Rqc2 family fibronectin-binding protein [Desulfuromonadales bacterium]